MAWWPSSLLAWVAADGVAVGKPKGSGRGFSAAQSSRIPRQRSANGSGDHVVKEKQAVALINQGKLQEAEDICIGLIGAGTVSHTPYLVLSTIRGMRGDIDGLMEFARQALCRKPDSPAAHNNLGYALKEKGELERAVSACRTAIRLRPGYAEAHNNLGNALKEQGDLIGAIACYKAAIELKSGFPEAHNNLGVVLEGQGDLPAAIAAYRTAIEFNPGYAEAHRNLGVALKEQGDLAAAIASYGKALEFNPNYPEALNNLGNALKEYGDLAAAITSYQSAMKLKPDYPDAHNNLGIALHEQGDLAAAIASYGKALELRPTYPEAQKNLSMTELLVGDYKGGWERYEYRFQCEADEGILNANPRARQWIGGNLDVGRRLLLVSEQGLGDTLQFMRFAIVLQGQGASASLCAPAKLHSLIQVSGIDQSPLTPEQANAFTEGLWIPLLSVPRHLQVSPENPIIVDPYIKTTDELVCKWRGILAGEKRPVIGLNWQGNPRHEKTDSQGRSLPLETFAPLAEQAGISLLSLQKGYGSEQLATCSFRDRFVSCQPRVNETWDFLETAAMIANCDLVITSDTSVAHLAGGMGRPTWLLLKKIPEWRWGLEGDTTFWYPSMRLFRQVERGNWDEVLQRVARELRELFL